MRDEDHILGMERNLRSMSDRRKKNVLLRVNEEITASPVGLWDENQQWHSDVPIADALAHARAVGQDLVEFAPKFTPPVCQIGNRGDYDAHGLANDLAAAKFRTDPRELDLVRQFEGRGVRSGQYLLLLTPADAILFAEEAARRDIGTLGPNYWYGPGWEWWPAPDYSTLVSDPAFVQKSLARLTEDLESLPEGVAFVQILLQNLDGHTVP
jgi:hypothetical protein